MHYMNMTSKSDCIGVTCTKFCHIADTFLQWNSSWRLHTWQKTIVVTNCTSPLPFSYGSTTLCGGVYARRSRLVYHFGVCTNSVNMLTGICQHENMMIRTFFKVACYILTRSHVLMRESVVRNRNPAHPDFSWQNRAHSFRVFTWK